MPARPSRKGEISVVETFGDVKGKMKSGLRKEAESGLTAFARDFEFCYQFGGRAALGGILSSSKKYLRSQSVPQRKHNTSPLHRSTG
jgi:hypothetical protein